MPTNAEVNEFEIELLETAIANRIEDNPGIDAATDMPLQVWGEKLAKLRAGEVIDPLANFDYVEHGVGHRPQGGAVGANQYGTFQVRYPSERQVAFVKRLLGERVIPASTQLGVHERELEAFNAGTANLRQTSDLISWLLTLPQRPADQVVAELATDKQLAFLKSLIASRDLTGTAYPAWTDEIFATLTKRQASASIEQLKDLPKVEVKTAVQVERSQGVVTVGAYKVGTKVIRVYPNQTRERLLAKEWNTETHEWDYLGMASRFVKADQLMSLDEAKEFGALTGMCCVCGRTLTDPNSVDAGIGPICSGKLR